MTPLRQLAIRRLPPYESVDLMKEALANGIKLRRRDRVEDGLRNG